MAKRILGVIMAILIVVGGFPTNSANAQVGCSQEAVIINPPASSTFDGRLNVNPTAPAGFMAVLFVGIDMPGEPQKAILLRPAGGWLTYSSGVFYAVCSGDLRGLAVGHGWRDLYVRGNYLSPVEVWDMRTPPGERLARWEAYTPILAPVPVPSPYPYVPVPVPYPPQPAPVAPPFPFQPAPIAFLPQPIQSCGPLNYTTVDTASGRVYGAAAVRATFDNYQLKVVIPVSGEQTLTVREARAVEVVEAPGCGSDVVGAVANYLVAQGGSISHSNAPSWVQSRISLVRR